MAILFLSTFILASASHMFGRQGFELVDTGLFLCKDSKSEWLTAIRDEPVWLLVRVFTGAEGQ
ncbi:hypothetical protein PSAC2689_10171 [Paraburkholderia sacchari]